MAWLFCCDGQRGRHVVEDVRASLFSATGVKCCPLQGSDLHIPAKSIANRDQILAAVHRDGLALQRATDALRNDRALVLAAVHNAGESLEFASDALKDDPDLVLVAVLQNGLALRFASEALRADRNLVEAAVRQDGAALSFASLELQNDAKLQLAARSAPSELRAQLKQEEEFHFGKLTEPEALHAATRTRRQIEPETSPEDQWTSIPEGAVEADLERGPLDLRRDKTFLMRAVKLEGCTLEFAAPSLQEDRELVMAAVQQNGMALEFASLELQQDREVVLAAVKGCGRALRFAAPELLWDRELLLEAFAEDGTSLQFAPRDLRADREVVVAALKQSGLALQFASPELKADRGVVLFAIRQCSEALQFAAESLRQDRPIVLVAIRQNGLALQHAAPCLRADRSIVLAAVGQDDRALDYASEELQTDPEVILATVRQNATAVQYASAVLAPTTTLAAASSSSALPSPTVQQGQDFPGDFGKSPSEIPHTAKFVRSGGRIPRRRTYGLDTEPLPMAPVQVAASELLLQQQRLDSRTIRPTTPLAASMSVNKSVAVTTVPNIPEKLEDSRIPPMDYDPDFSSGQEPVAKEQETWRAEVCQERGEMPLQPCLYSM